MENCGFYNTMISKYCSRQSCQTCIFPPPKWWKPRSIKTHKPNPPNPKAGLQAMTFRIYK